MYPVYTYRDIDELRKIQKEQKVYPFEFIKTKDILDENPAVCVDITAVTYFVNKDKGSIQPVYINFESINENTKVIVTCEASIIAIKLFPFLFDRIQPYYEEKSITTEGTLSEYMIPQRKIIYRYEGIDDLEEIINYTSEKRIPFTTFSQANGETKKQFNKFEELAIVDLTSIAYAIEGNKSLIYLVEQFFEIYPNISFVVCSPQVDQILTYFPLFFGEQEHILNLLPDLDINADEETLKTEVAKVIQLDNSGFDKFWESFDHNLIGHRYFKKRLKAAIMHFMVLNQVKEQKVFSMFLYGPSGIGKTEVARQMASCLKEDGYLPKINFQNYSSQDSLNSLIGSPAGYVGCEHGELSDKIQKGTVGILLCDEFEKTNRPVFSFFLELLEDGKFTDSMAREYDMDGYIIIFTSNIQSESDYKKTIPPELQTRFDLVCEFEQPSETDKRDFLVLLLEKAKEKFKNQIQKYNISEDELSTILQINYSGTSSLRDLKRLFNNKIIELLFSKGNQL